MSTSTVDAIRALATYLIALLVVVGGGLAIYQSRADAAAADTVAIMAGFVGSALTFVFGQEVQRRTAKDARDQTANGHGGQP